jgi:hypothetical protein
MNNNTKVATVLFVERLKHSATGNPAWLVTFEDGSQHRTKANTMFAHELTETNLLGRLVNVHLTRAGRIIDMRKCAYITSDSGMEFISNRWVYTGKRAN